MTYDDRTTPAEEWVNRLDDMGPHAPLPDLRAMLATAPADAPADLVELLRGQIAAQEARRHAS